MLWHPFLPGVRSGEVLAAEEFADGLVFEDGVQQEVTFFTDEKTNPPVYVGVLMDTSPSTAGKLGFSKEAAANFLLRHVSPSALPPIAPRALRVGGNP